MRRFGSRLVLTLLAVGLNALLRASPATAGESTWVVDDDRGQCASADFLSIREALDDPRVIDGALIRVCPGIYSDVLTVGKSVALRGDPDAVEAEDCFRLPASLDAAIHAVVRPAVGAAPATGISVLADNVTVAGFVIEGWDTGLQTADTHSGYRISHNVVQSNRIGIDIRSSGALPSRIDHNCVRGNPDETTRPLLAAGIASEPDRDALGVPLNAPKLANVRVDHNSTFENREGIALLGPGAKSNLLVDHNVMVETAQPVPGGRWTGTGLFPLGIAIENSESSRILDNAISGARFGIFVAGGNVGLEIGRNDVQDGRQGLFGTINAAAFGISFRTPASGQTPTTDATVYENVVTRMSFGIHAQPNALTDSLLIVNVANENFSAVPAAVGDGIRLMSGDTRNVVTGNTANGNSAHGVYAQLATGNSFDANTMLGNGVWDARDDSSPLQNVWSANTCSTDQPDGLCATQ